jgi:DNA sulfur modification protein DndD
MRIASLAMDNFMAYRGKHFVDFRTEESSPVILFLGENGHGKSTVQHAARWCLYGSTEDKGVEIERSDLINRKARAANPEAEMSVTLTWLEGGNTYELRREIIPGIRGERPGMTATLRVNGGNPEPSGSIHEFVHRFLAKDIAHFVFFNGEVQQEFDEMATNSGSAEFIRREIQKTLSIPVIAECVSWLRGRATDESNAIIKANKHDQKVAGAEKKRQEAEEVVSKLQEEYNEALFRRNGARHEIEKLQEKMSNIESIQQAGEELAATKAERDAARAAEASKMDTIRDLLSRNPWLPLAPVLLKRKSELEGMAQEARASATHLARLTTELQQLNALRDSEECPLCHSRHDVTASEIVERMQEVEAAIQAIGEIDLSEIESEIRQMQSLGVDASVHSEVRNAEKALNSASADLAKKEQRISELEEDLSLRGDINVKDIMTTYRGHVATETSASEAMADYTKQIEEKKREIRKYESEVGKAKGVSPQQRRSLAAYEYLSELLQESLEIYTDEVKRQVETFASETFMAMISDPKYSGLRINNNFGVDLVMTDGQTDPLRSTGQGKIATISLISGLIKTAMSEGSILMDTPLVSLDEGHRRQVAQWAYSSGLWVSLFMHSGEFKSDQHLGFFDGRVGRIYRIRQVDENESTIEEMIGMEGTL